jgi:peptide/nickel transport system permease protein
MAARQEVLLGAAAGLRRRVARQARWSSATLWVGVAIVVVIALAGLLAPLIAPYPPTKQSLLDALQGPSGAHLFGTDQFGRDVFSRALHAIRIDLVLGLVTTYVPLVAGMALGAIAGLRRGWVDGFVTWLVDVTIALPFIVLVLAIVAIVGPGLTGVYIGLMIVSWALYARLTRAEMLVLREQQFILAARALGYSTPRILLRHALPHLLRPNLVFSMADIVLNILVLASLSFLGVGVQPPTPELGAIVADGQQYLLTAWWITTLPGLVLVVMGAGFSLIGDGFADRFGRRLELPK